MSPGRANAVAVDDTHHSHGLGALLRRASSTAPSPRRTLVKARPAADDHHMASPKHSISSEEYAALPVSVQRKYFSSEERLAITQRSAAEKRQRQPSKQSSTASTSSRSPVLPVFPKRRRTFNKTVNVKTQRRSSLPSAWNFDNEIAASSNDPQWFDALPDKVKRSQFSRSEIEAIDARKTTTTTTTERPRTSSACKPTFDTFSWVHAKPLHKQPSFHSPSVSVSPSTCSNQTSQSAPQISRSHSPMTAATSFTSRSTPASPAIPALTLTAPRGDVAPALKRPSLRRPFVLQPLPLPPPVLAPVPYSPSPDTTSYINTIRTLGSSPLLLDDAMEDEETTPTQETEDARLDLTLPPEWYDEKLNFDFDSDFHKPSVSTNSSDQPRTLSPSISDAASFDTSGPMTPLSPATHLPTHFDQSINRLPPLPRPSSSNTPDSIAQNAAVTNFSHPQHAAAAAITAAQYHERASPRLKPQRKHTPRHLVDGFYENQHDTPYSITIQYNSKDNDPLALEALPICDDLTGAHGAFAVGAEEHHHQTTGFRKVLKVIRGH